MTYSRNHSLIDTQQCFEHCFRTAELHVDIERQMAPCFMVDLLVDSKKGCAIVVCRAAVEAVLRCDSGKVVAVDGFSKLKGQVEKRRWPGHIALQVLVEAAMVTLCSVL
jgi:hypothetical protein